MTLRGYAITACIGYLMAGWAAPVSAQTGSPPVIELGGYLKELGQFSFSNSLDELRYDNTIHHRLESEWTFSDHWEFRADVRNLLVSGYSVRNTPGIADYYDRDPNFLDLSHLWFNTESSLLVSAIDRLYLSYFNGPWEVHAGRQRINWGRTFVWNPNDLFNPYAFLNFDYEERPGVDALSVQYNWSYASSVEAGVRVADRFDEMVIAGMVRTSWGSYDVQFTGGHYQGLLTVGTGWSGYLGDAGFKGEASYFHPEDSFFSSTGHLTATAGFDYMFANSLYLQSEFLYNGGYDRALSPLAELTRPPGADDLFIARTGFFLGGSYPVNPLVNASLGFLGSFDRSLFIAIPQVSVSVTQDLDLLVLSQLLKGRVFNRALETPNLLFVRLRYSY